MPTWNRNCFLQRAVESVLDQTFSDWELIVVDDGSVDESWKTLQKLRDPRVHYVYQKHGGVSLARNTGIRLSNSPWICFLDSDDYWKPLKLQRQIEALENFSGYHITYTNEIWIRHGKHANPKKIHQKYGGWIYHRCLPLCIVSPSSILVHRTVLEESGLFDESFPVCEDYELWLRIFCRWPVLFLKEPLIVKIGGHSDQLSRKIWGMDRYRLQALQKILTSGDLTPIQEFWTGCEIVKKASILATGFSKHHKFLEAEKYKKIKKELQKELQRSPFRNSTKAICATYRPS